MKGIFKGALLLMLLVTFGFTSCGEKERNFIGLPLPPNDVDDGGNPGGGDGGGGGGGGDTGGDDIIPDSFLEALRYHLRNGTFVSSGKFTLELRSRDNLHVELADNNDALLGYYVSLPLTLTFKHKDGSLETRDIYGLDPIDRPKYDRDVKVELISISPYIPTSIQQIENKDYVCVQHRESFGIGILHRLVLKSTFEGLSITYEVTVLRSHWQGT